MTGRPPPKRHPSPSRKLEPGKNLPRVKAPITQIEGVVISLSQEDRPFLYEGCPEITYGGHTYYLSASSVEKYGGHYSFSLQPLE